MDVTKEGLKKFVKEETQTLNDIQAWNMGFVSTDEIEPKLELLRRINRVFELGIPKEEIRDYFNRNKR